MPTKSLGQVKRHIWTEPETAELMRRYPHENTGKLAASMRMTIGQINAKASALGLHKTPEYLTSPEAGRTDGKRGDKTRFQKGHSTWNKGMKGIDIGGKETRFQKGHRGGRAAEVYQPIGAVRISKDGYLQRKINDDLPLQKRWRGVHILVWEEINGPLPEGHAVTLKDGNKQNTAPENLELVSRADLMRRNTYHNYGKDIAQLVQLKGAITRQINKRERKSE